MQVTGLYRPRDSGSQYWGIDLIARSGISIAPSEIGGQPRVVSYGPAVASPAAFGPGRLAVGEVSWIVLPSAAGIRDGDLSGLAGKISHAVASLQGNNGLYGAQVSSGLPQLLSGLATNLVVAKSLLVISALQLALLAAVALGLAARLLASHREEEVALLTARGATRWQLARPSLAETVLFGGAAAAAGVLVGTRLAAVLVAATEPNAGIRLSGIPASAWWAALAVLALAAAVVLWPAVRPVTPGAARVRSGRQAALASMVRAGADLALLALALLAVWELRTYSAVARPAAGGIGIDPVIAMAPALALAAAAVIPLRLLPAAARLIERVAARGRRLAAALAGWEISRRPVRQSGPVLLVIIATAAATLALAQYQTWRRSAADQAAFAVGADSRADLLEPLPPVAAGAIARSPGVRAAMPVSRVSAESSGELLAVDARTAPATVPLRSDLSPYPARQLWTRLVPAQAPAGLAVPGRPAQLEIMASLVPGSAALSPGPAAVTASIQDADGIVYVVGAGSLPADGRVHALTAELSADPPGGLPAAAARALAQLQPAALPAVARRLPAGRARRADPAGDQRARRPAGRRAVRRRPCPGVLVCHGLLDRAQRRRGAGQRGAGGFGRGSARADQLAAGRPRAAARVHARLHPVRRGAGGQLHPGCGLRRAADHHRPAPGRARSGHRDGVLLAVQQLPRRPGPAGAGQRRHDPGADRRRRARVPDRRRRGRADSGSGAGAGHPGQPGGIPAAGHRVVARGLERRGPRGAARLLGDRPGRPGRRPGRQLAVGAAPAGRGGDRPGRDAARRDRVLGQRRGERAGQASRERGAVRARRGPASAGRPALPGAADAERAGRRRGVAGRRGAGLARGPRHHPHRRRGPPVPPGAGADPGGLGDPAGGRRGRVAGPGRGGEHRPAARPGRGAARRGGVMTARYARLDGAPGGPRPSPPGAWVKIAGTAAAAGVGLALLVLATVAISVALPRFSVSHRTTALRRTLSTVPAASTAVLGNLSYLTFDVDFSGQPFTAADLTTAGTQLAAGLAGQGLPLARPFWSGLSAAYATVTGAGPRTASALPPEMEILYRDQLTRYGRLTAGRLPQQGVTSNGQAVLQVAVTGATAARYGLRPGSRLGMGPDVTLEVTGIVTPVDPGSAFWGVDPIAAAPALDFTPPPASSPYWIGACFIGPAEVPVLQASVPTDSMQVSWAVPLSLAHLSASQVPALTDRLSGALADGGMVRNGAGQQISGPLAAQVPLSSGLLPVLSGFTAEDQAIGAVLGLLFVSLAAIGIVAVVLAAALVATRRGPEFAVMRARGASLRQVTGRALASSAAFTLPAAAAGAGLAVLLTPGWSTAISWWLGGCALAAALGGVPLVVVARLRSAGRGPQRSARFTPAAVSRRMAVVRRLVAEAALAAAAVGGIIVLRRQGLSAGSVDVYSAAAPVLVAVLAAIVVVHVYPVLLRLLLRLARVRPGVSAFVGLSQATRTAPGAIAVVFALVLALAMVAFGTMIDDAVHRGEVAESWSQVGADAVIYASASSRPRTPAVQREIAAVPGAARTAAVPVATGTLSFGAHPHRGPGEPGGTTPRWSPAPRHRPSRPRPSARPPRARCRAGVRRPRPRPAAPGRGGRLTVGGRPLTVRPAGLARAIPGVPAGPSVALPAGRSAAGPARWLFSWSARTSTPRRRGRRPARSARRLGGLP